MNILEMAMAAKMSGGKGGGLTKLPDGYPYKEKAFEDIVWDGDTEGRTSIDGFECYKVGEALTYEQLIGSTMEVLKVYSGETVSYKLIAGHLAEVLPGVIAIDGGSALSALEPVAIDGLEIKEAGLYFASGTAEYIVGLYAPETIHTMAPEFLPTEEWTFTLEDDTTVTKKVVVVE